MGGCVSLPADIANGSVRQYSFMNVTPMTTKKGGIQNPQHYIISYDGYMVEVAYLRAQGRRPHQEDYFSLCSLNSRSESQFRHDDLFGPPAKFEAHFYRPETDDEVEKQGRQADVAWFGVYDGHGGERISEYAAKNLHTAFLDRFNKMKDKNSAEELCTMFKDCFLGFDNDIKMLAPLTKQGANGNCLSQAEFNYLQSTNNSGSTATVMSLTKDASNPADVLFTVAHCGDSRLVAFSVDKNFDDPAMKIEMMKSTVAEGDSKFDSLLPDQSALSNKEAQRMRKMLRGQKHRAATEQRNVFAKRVYATVDHQPMEPSELRRILRDGGQVINNRVNGVLAVSRALGDMDQKAQGGLVALPETFCVPMAHLLENQEEVVVVIASDGLWTYFTSDQVQADVTELLCRGLSLSQTCQVVMERVILDCKGIDNTSIILVRIKKEKVSSESSSDGEGVPESELDEDRTEDVMSRVNHEQEAEVEKDLRKSQQPPPKSGPSNKSQKKDLDA